MSFRKLLLTSKLPPTGQFKTNRQRQNQSYTPVEWKEYFESCKDILIGDDSFKLYSSVNAGPPLVILLHGGGYSGLTWALFTKQLLSMVACHVIALDLRGHGCSKTLNDKDLSVETFVQDICKIIEKEYTDWPCMVLMGHSMGGAIAVHLANSGRLKKLVGLVVIDVVEGTALEALSGMQSFLRNRPNSFRSISEAIGWSLNNGQVKNIESALVSVPGQLMNRDTGELASIEIQNQSHTATEGEDQKSQKSGLASQTIPEEEGEFQLPRQSRGRYVWRVNLCETEKYWQGWFQGISQKFISCKAQKLLLLANVDRLDKILTVGQMQGKFAMHVLPKSGHAVHEDEPEQVAKYVSAFLIRNKFAVAREPLT